MTTNTMSWTTFTRTRPRALRSTWATATGGRGTEISSPSKIGRKKPLPMTGEVSGARRFPETMRVLNWGLEKIAQKNVARIIFVSALDKKKYGKYE